MGLLLFRSPFVVNYLLSPPARQLTDEYRSIQYPSVVSAGARRSGRAPLCGGSESSSTGGLSGRGGTPPRIPRAMGRRHGKGSMPQLECRSWEAWGRSPRRRQPGLHRRARARRRRRTLLRPAASLRPRSLAWSSPTRPQNPNAVDVETRELRRPGARSPVIYLCFVLNSPALVLFRLLQNPNWLSCASGL